MRVPYAQSVHGKEEIDAVVNVLNSNTSLGRETLVFEQKVASHFGKKSGVMVNSGSSANLLALELLNAKPGDEVITPLLTFSTVVAPIIQKGLVPVFVDIDPDTFVVRPKDVEAAISPKTKALLIPSLLGNLPDLQSLAEIAAKHNLVFIEDSCDTIGGSFSGKPTGSFSHISTTSFYGSHIINGAGGGGMIMVNDDAWLKRLLVLRGWGRESSLFGEGRESELPENRFNASIDNIRYDRKFLFSEIGYNFLPLEVSAAFANIQIKKLEKFAKSRRDNFQKLHSCFDRWPGYFKLPRMTQGADSIWLAFPITVQEDAPFSRTMFAEELERAGIQTRPIFTGNILKQPGFNKIPHRLAMDTYPGTEQVMRNGLVFGCHQGLTDAQLDHIITTSQHFVDSVFAQTNTE